MGRSGLYSEGRAVILNDWPLSRPTWFRDVEILRLRGAIASEWLNCAPDDNSGELNRLTISQLRLVRYGSNNAWLWDI